MAKMLQDNFLDIVKNASALSMPDSPSRAGYSPKENKMALARASLILASAIKKIDDGVALGNTTVKMLAENPATFNPSSYEDGTLFIFRYGGDISFYLYEGGDFDQIGRGNAEVDSDLEALESYFTSGKANKAIADEDGNSIKTTYGKLASANTWSAKNTYTADVQLGSSGSDNSKALDIYFTTNLRGPTYVGNVRPGNTGFSIGYSDAYWNGIYGTTLHLNPTGGIIQKGDYAYTLPTATGTLALTSYVDAEIDKFKDGTYTAKKAEKDEDGNVISSTYVKKSQIVDDLTHTDTNKPLSANQGKVLKGLIDTINALLDSDDTDLDTVQEIVTYIKSNKSVLDTYSTSKLNKSDLVTNYSTDSDTLPLASSVAVLLKDLIDDIVDGTTIVKEAEKATKDEDGNGIKATYIKKADALAIGLLQIGEYDQSTGKIAIYHSSDYTISYSESTGKLTISIN